MTRLWLVHILSAVLQIQPTENLFCPSCEVHHACLQNGTTCTLPLPTCELTSHGTNIVGKCKEGQYCIPSRRTDCCNNDACVQKSVLDFKTTTVAVNMTSHPHQTPSHIAWYNHCQDEIDSNTENCTLMKQYGLCSDHIGVRVCPETCGFCTYLTIKKGSDLFCEDKLIDNECETLKISNDICNDPISNFTCPETCGYCDILFEAEIISFLNDVLTATTTTPQPCVDTLDGGDCSLLPNVCTTNLAEKVCRKFCGHCDSPLVG